MLDKREELIKMYYKEYDPRDEHNYFLTFPEYMIKKLNYENSSILYFLPPLEKRTREDVYNWMLSSPFSEEEIIWVGW